MASHGLHTRVVSTDRDDEVAGRIGLLTAGSRIRLRLADDERLVALVRRGDTAAFEALYERHSSSLLSFCIYMLGSRHDAEDVIQATFTSAYRALRADQRPVALRAWLFTIARNGCLNSLRGRHPTVELNGEQALAGDPWRELEVKEELRRMLDGLRELPERQRAALVLSEVHGLSQAEIAAVLGVRAEQVKAYVHQARANLAADRRAREDDCREIREELAIARGSALLRGRLRRHVRSCSDCRRYADGVARQRRQLSALLPLGPTLMLRYRTIEEALGSAVADPAACAGSAASGGSAAGVAMGLAGGGLQALVAKMATGIVVLGVGASVLSSPNASRPQSPPALARARSSLLASVRPIGAAGVATPQTGDEVLGVPRASGGAHSGTTIRPVTAGGLPTVQGAGRAATVEKPGSPAPEREAHASAGGARARASEEERRRSREERASKHEEARQLLVEQRERAREEHQQAHEEHQAAKDEHQQVQEEREHAQEEREHAREQHKQTHEEQGPKRTSGLPKTEAERRRLREERKAKGISRAPRTEEERRRARERREARRAGRQDVK